MTAKVNKKLLKAVSTISMVYKKGSNLSPEVSCQRFGVTTREIDDLGASHAYSDKQMLVKELNALVDEGYLIKSVSPGQQAKWMVTEKA